MVLQKERNAFRRPILVHLNFQSIQSRSIPNQIAFIEFEAVTLYLNSRVLGVTDLPSSATVQTSLWLSEQPCADSMLYRSFLTIFSSVNLFQAMIAFRRTVLSGLFSTTEVVGPRHDPQYSYDFSVLFVQPG